MCGGILILYRKDHSLMNAGIKGASGVKVAALSAHLVVKRERLIIPGHSLDNRISAAEGGQQLQRFYLATGAQAGDTFDVRFTWDHQIPAAAARTANNLSMMVYGDVKVGSLVWNDEENGEDKSTDTAGGESQSKKTSGPSTKSTAMKTKATRYLIDKVSTQLSPKNMVRVADIRGNVILISSLAGGDAHSRTEPRPPENAYSMSELG
ncbi:uncharacterized protein BT62DRAFT_999502 [Guyanagaster necrorhizus]|uniref:Uncharacterized protein n=1 Tax=Guyanagaster necrorhizus TaxID=856835 RepID=A0A9P7W4H1_9AGAR|nr:uncharacterized protein BT62DRAFT_999502 [Guyanagaster necrorhizus MCA 3950]KAG7451800.1 hypothetical protein BT62DRAFT_999502 [Guyanagaster necrorhizus MCA 3950]